MMKCLESEANQVNLCQSVAKNILRFVFFVLFVDQTYLNPKTNPALEPKLRGWGEEPDTKG